MLNRLFLSNSEVNIEEHTINKNSGTNRENISHKPAERDRRGRVQEENVSRRQAWIQALRRSDLTENKIKNFRICSDHFISGKPAEIADLNNSDYVPHKRESNRKRLQSKTGNQECQLSTLECSIATPSTSNP
ncbi:hypothetical protein RN001_011801 [Aquatica leii]|uniref:THAP-type domain-containing protein n=1 Tax=Aquatica leii TaxID=1421715 RepID=A0AAN7P236_9COLE|nr:hypothetical protein RN001_011801 [Aquatica leii]